MVETNEGFRIKQTFFVPAWSIERDPKSIGNMPEGGHEVALHDYIHENPTVVGRVNEVYWLLRSIEIIEPATGRCPRGWPAPLNSHSNHSAELLAEEGFLFDASLMGEYVPCVLRTNKGDIIELLAHWGLAHWSVDGWPQFVQFMDLEYMLQITSAAVGLDVIKQEFDAMWEYGGLFVDVWHPFRTGRLAR
jgi:peptidoglycan/xylan/chitin deacetylase (PgdA/CDA1 family)